MEPIEITSERNANGSYLLSTIYNEQYYKQIVVLFDDDTLEDAEDEFREYVLAEDAKIIRGQ